MHGYFELLWLHFAETWGIFSSTGDTPGDSKLTPDGLGLM